MKGHWQKGMCKTNGIHIAYTRTGGDRPPLVLLHGLFASGLCWLEVARSLESQYDVIMPDARGHGHSSAPASGYRYADHAEDIAGLIQTLRLGSVILLGHSMGGMTAALTASRWPYLCSRLILEDPTFLSVERQRQVWDSDIMEKHRQILHSPLADIAAHIRQRHPQRREELIRQLAEARLQTCCAALHVLMPPNPDYKQLMRKIDMSCLLLFGDAGVISWSVAQELQHMNHKLKVQQIAAAGHGLHFDQVERFVQAVESFICYES